MRMKDIAECLQSEDGQGMVEYALIIAFVAIVATLVFSTSLGETIANMFGVPENQVNAVDANLQGQ